MQTCPKCNEFQTESGMELMQHFIVCNPTPVSTETLAVESQEPIAVKKNTIPEKCEICENAEPTTFFHGMHLCADCKKKEHESFTELMKPENQQARVDAANQIYKEREELNKILRQAQNIDTAVQVKADIFNAETVSIADIKKAIDEDNDIPAEQKAFKLAQFLADRLNHYKQVIFDMNQKIVEEANKQRAVQQYLNTMANQLRAEEREKLKLQDINYKPTAPKTVKTAKVKTASKKLDKNELRKYAQELGVAEFTLQMLCVAKGLTVEEAANQLRRSIKESISESGN